MPRLGLGELLLIVTMYAVMFGAPAFLIWRFVQAMKHRNRIGERMDALLADAEGLRTEARLIVQEMKLLQGGDDR